MATQTIVRAATHGVVMNPKGSFINVPIQASPDAYDNLGVELMMNTRQAVRHHYAVQEGIKSGNFNLTDVMINAEQDIRAFWDAPQSECFTLFLVVISLICLDAFIAKRVNISSYKTHVGMVCFWVACGIGYNMLYVTRHGWRDGIDWFIGYVLEWMLSLDNLFAFQFIMRVYSAPPAIQHKALFLGVASAMVWRLLMFFALGWMMHSIHYVQFLFGFILIYAGVQAIHGDDEDQDPNELIFIRLLKRCLGDRLLENYDTENHALFVWHPETGRLCATLLVPLIFCIEVSDLIFAVDSVSAKVAQIPNQYIAYSSSVLAILGLRAMYFVIDDLVRYFDTLKYGVGFILMFIGGELMISGRYQLPDWIVCVVILSVFNFCIVLSVIHKLMWPTPAADIPAGGAAGKDTAAPKGNQDEEEGRNSTSSSSAAGSGEAIPVMQTMQWKGASGHVSAIASNYGAADAAAG